MKKDHIYLKVERLFKNASDRLNKESRTNPVTGGRWVPGLDPIRTQKAKARRALAAREWFAENGPPDAPPLPLTYNDREELKGRFAKLPPAQRDYEFDRVTAWFARSLAAIDYDYDRHPSFDDYARGVLASPYAPPETKADAKLRSRYSPKALADLGPGLQWRPCPGKTTKRRATVPIET